MNTDLESDCEGMTSHGRTQQQQSRQHLVSPKTTTNLSNTNNETVESSTPKSNASQKRIDRGNRTKNKLLYLRQFLLM